MSDEENSRPTTIGSELRVMSDSGELAGFIGETRESPTEGQHVYARPCHDNNASLGVHWFATREEAMTFLKDSLKS